MTRLWLTYDKFKNDYWPHFPQNWTKGLDPAMIFSELMGVILGSEAALESKHSHLDRDAYLAFRPRLASSTSEAQKSRIYDLFERYLEEKRRTGDLDVADRTRMLLEDFRRNGVPGQKVDFLYVDEVQDNLLVDTLLLRSICHNRDGLFWAGDTAQSISAGSSFRFKELKAFLHRVEGRNSDKQLQIAQSMRSVPPKMFQLTTNYRSHAGIVNCARTIVETITKLWPGSIDKLQPERATVDGLKPMFFDNWDADNVQRSQFLFGDQTSGARIDFGAQQCILVRDKEAKERLERIVGNIGIVMSLYDSKGLEFNDILLYDFFADSEVEESQWRVVLNMVVKDLNAPTPDIVKHASVCMELKFLYVAVTRARNNLWIADSSTKGEPMRVSSRVLPAVSVLTFV
ncbi:UvrD-like helicase ATP-binding domain-containing protein [Mycena kentingensis (nom. inval.)]|nr:UvrD-like helicase ATP-binding domain-containing protein [Mycena kentingensis (nom. inval.)]